MSATVPAAPAYPTPPPPQPDLRFGTLMSEGIELLRKHFLALALPLMLLAIVTGAGRDPAPRGMTVEDATVPANWFALLPFFALIGLIALAVLVALFFAYVLVHFLTTRAALEALEGREPRPFGARFSEAWARVLPASGTFALAVLFIVLGFMALVVPGIIIATALLPLAAVVVAEGRSGMDAIRRAWALTRGRRWTLFAILLVTTIASTVAGALVGWVPFVGGALAGAVNGIGSAFLAVVAVVFYRRALQ